MVKWDTIIDNHNNCHKNKTTGGNRPYLTPYNTDVRDACAQSWGNKLGGTIGFEPGWPSYIIDLYK